MYKTVHFPLDVPELAQAIPEAGYVVTEKELLRPPFGARIQASATLGTKGDIELRIASDRNVIAIRGSDIDGVLREFEVLERFLRDRFALDSEGTAQFYELLAEGIVTSDGNPVSIIARQSEQASALKLATKVLGFPVSNFGLRMIGADQEPNDVNWTEVRIEPTIQDGGRRFWFSIIFRKPDRQAVLGFLEGLHGTLNRLIQAFERS